MQKMTDLFSAVEIEVNHSCNRKCSYCPNSILERRSQGEIAPKIFSKLLAELRGLDFSGRISYDFYNEPLLHPDFEGLVRRTRQELPATSIEVYTNGTLLTKERFERLGAAGVSHFVVTRHEKETVYKFEEVFRSLDPEQKRRVTYRPFTELTLTNRGGVLPHLGREGLALTPCFIPTFVVTVTLAGNVLPCFEDFHEELVMGNLQENTLMEIWNSGKYTALRDRLKKGQRHLFSPCKSCNRREVLPPPQ